MYKAFPRARHGLAAARLLRRIGPLGDDEDDEDDPEGWWLLEPDVRLDPDIVVPDLAGWRRARLAALPEETAPIDVVPDWVCEVLSPGHERHDRVFKQALYLGHGVAHYWIVSPEARVLEAYQRQDGRWVLLGSWTDGAVVRIPPFDAVEITVGQLFARPAQPG